MKYLACLVLLSFVCGCGKSKQDLYREASDDLSLEIQLLERLEKKRDEMVERHSDKLAAADKAAKDLEDIYERYDEVLRKGNATDGDHEKALNDHIKTQRELMKERIKLIETQALELSDVEEEVAAQSAVVKEARDRRDAAKAAAE